MENNKLSFKVVKYSYIALLVLGIIGSVLIVFVGIYTLADKSDDYDSYEMIKSIYGVNVKDMEKTYDASEQNGSEDYKVKRIERNILGGLLTFIGMLSVAFHVTALIGAIKENVTITTVVLVLSIIGTVSTFIRMSAFNFATFVTQLVFIALIAVYLKMIRKQRDSRLQNFVHICTSDVENGGKGVNSNLNPYQPYVFANSPPPGYEEFNHDKSKILS